MIKSKIKYFLDNIQIYKEDEKIIEQIDKHQEITFDIFDTLIKRNVPNPKDVFSVIESILGENNFRKKRVEAEIKAREKKTEVTLDEIYDEYECTNLNRETIKRAEIEFELSMCVVNIDILPIFKYACEKKRVFLVSDMYLSRAVIEEILNNAGIVGYEQLIISNELNINKHSGDLYNYVREKYELKNPLHIGNDFVSDYLMAKKQKFDALKIRTNTYRLDRKYLKVNNSDYLNAFLSNHHSLENGDYYNFGFERFGPVLYGFTKWLYEDMEKEKIDEVFFMARDGYIMKKIYDQLGCDKNIPDRYFEVSRRSLRVPRYAKFNSLEEIMGETPLLSVTNMEQILDSFGLNPLKYKEIINKYGFNLDSVLKRDNLVNEKKFVALFNEIKDDIFENAIAENDLLLEYLKQFDFSKKIAIVDIGWGGSIQSNLIQTLDENHIENDVIGYYFGLAKESKNKLGKKGYKAKGYLFDCLNSDSDHDIEISFRPLFETLFLEQSGSIMKYEHKDNVVVAKRYPYEYEIDRSLLPEALRVRDIQAGALQFARKYSLSKLSDYIGDNRELYFDYIYSTGTNPSKKDLEMYGDFLFFNNGSEAYLSKTKGMGYYIIHPKQFLKDLSAAQWKIGYLKRTLKVRLPYLKIYTLLHKIANRTED